MFKVWLSFKSDMWKTSSKRKQPHISAFHIPRKWWCIESKSLWVLLWLCGHPGIHCLLFPEEWPALLVASGDQPLLWTLPGMRSKQETSTVINTHLAFNIVVARMKKSHQIGIDQRGWPPITSQTYQGSGNFEHRFHMWVPPGTERIMICPIRNIWIGSTAGCHCKQYKSDSEWEETTLITNSRSSYTQTSMNPGVHETRAPVKWFLKCIPKPPQKHLW